jgi:hypothetical protein
MDSVRQIQCSNPRCGRVFYLCPWCDRGDWYCGTACKDLQRRRARQKIARVYWRSSAGKHMTLLRVRKLRKARASIVTDPGTAEVGLSPMLPSPDDSSLTSRVASAGAEKSHEFNLGGDRPGPDGDAGAGDARRERDDPEGETLRS